MSLAEPMETDQLTATVPVTTTIHQHIESYCELLSVNFAGIRSARSDFENGKKTVKAYRKLIFSSYKSLSKLPKDLVVMYLASITAPLVSTIPECLKPLQSLRNKLEINDDHELQLILEYHENQLKTKRTDGGTKSKRGRKPKQLVNSLVSLEAEELAGLEPQEIQKIRAEQTIRNWDEEPQRLSTLAMTFICANLPELREMYANARLVADTDPIREIIDRKLHWIDIFQNGDVSIQDMLNEYGASDIFLREAHI